MVLLHLYANARIHARIQPVLLYRVATRYRESSSLRSFVLFVETTLDLSPRFPRGFGQTRRNCRQSSRRSRRSRRRVASTARQKATSYFDKSRGSLLITGAHCDIQPSGIQGFNIIDTQQRGQHPRLLKESLSIECRTLLLYPSLKRSKLGEVPAIFR